MPPSTDSSIPYLHVDDIHTNAGVVDDCEAAARRGEDDFEKWDLDDYFRPPQSQISHVKLQSAAKPSVVRRTFVDTDSDSDWEVMSLRFRVSSPCGDRDVFVFMCGWPRMMS
jgi:hypothetical protein